jgi:hypothetical protein
MRVLLCFVRLAAPALAVASGLATPGAAQGRNAEDTRTIDNYRLTMPMVRRVLPATYALGAESCKTSRESDVYSLSLAQLTRTLEGCTPVMKSLREAGVRPREAALLYAALLRVSEQVARHGGKASALPAGVVRDNALLLEQNDREIRQLTETGGKS